MLFSLFKFYKITKIVHTFWLVKNLWFIVPDIISILPSDVIVHKMLQTQRLLSQDKNKKKFCG